jgi:hypothetical protein
VELLVIAGGNDQRINRPFVAVNFDVAVLNDPEVDLNQIFFIFIDFIAEMNTAAGDPGQRTAPQIKSVRIIGICYMQQSLNGLFTQKING